MISSSISNSLLYLAILSPLDTLPLFMNGMLSATARSHYRPIEIDETLDYDTKNRLMKEWWEKHINLFVKYKISEEIINKAAKDLRVMSFREGAKECFFSFFFACHSYVRYSIS